MLTFTREPPRSAGWPRLMTGPHPDAMGSYAPEAMRWAKAANLHRKASSGLRWWQQLALHRVLEHDRRGVLVWRDVLISAPRQTGKSWLERVACGWRIHQAQRWGEEQTLLHVAHKLVAAQEVWRPAARAMSQSASVRWANGEQQIELPDGSRWMIQAATDGAGVSFSLSMALVDEAWRVSRRVVDEAIAPTLVESTSPQLWLVSTAGTSESDLFGANRAAALLDVAAPARGSTLLLEWSAPPDPDLDIDDPGVWRAASPYWDERRAAAMRTARRNGTERAFRQQWLNQWIAGEAAAVLSDATYTAALTQDSPFGGVAFGVEVATDRSSAVIVACGGGVLDLAAEGDGVAWVAGWLADRVPRHDPVAVAFDALGPAAGIGEQLRDLLGARLLMLNGREVAAASGALFDRLTADPPEVRMHHHPSLHRAVVAAHQRRYGQTWVFSRDILQGVSGAPLAAAALALYGAEHAPADEPVEAPAIW